MSALSFDAGSFVAGVVGGVALAGACCAFKSWGSKPPSAAITTERTKETKVSQASRDREERKSWLRAVGTSCGALLAYVGVMHETVAVIVFPEGPSQFGGPFNWHAFGVALVGYGGWVTQAFLTKRLRGVAVATAAMVPFGAAIVAGCAMNEGVFHYWAFTLSAAGLGASLCARRLLAEEKAATAEDAPKEE
eukprot:CAMPEP_0205827734 /NCGR_PEP_ID=MMETSP0206-20130828/32934_1 /ASSEMBLY_ACC=CAM_ASM_000279 /TAXON_ID=36767 /ORGANISM="Euplotes focardii, Strain TN1" /LENGTH=191 /DNA_ID=CAMNT_0053128901 /DNA_START=42 /DNA_END=617 /DNA_ORIENTATION=+